MKIAFQMDYDRGNYIKQPVSIRFELKLLFSTSKQVVIFDIGACEGEESVKYSFLYPDANIYTFEPLPANIELIKGNFKKYGVSNASIHEVAVSSKDSFNHFYVSSGKPENIPDSDWEFGNKSSSLLEPSKYLKDNSFLTFKETIEVETITLKSFCKKHQINAIDFIHMDVQGAELMVPEGTDDLISAVKAIWLEVSTIDFYHNQPLVQDIKKFLNKNGFILLKNELHGEQGDQLYISKLHFSMLKVSFIKILMWAKFVVTRLTSILKLIL